MLRLGALVDSAGGVPRAVGGGEADGGGELVMQFLPEKEAAEVAPELY